MYSGIPHLTSEDAGGIPIPLNKMEVASPSLPLCPSLSLSLSLYFSPLYAPPCVYINIWRHTSMIIYISICIYIYVYICIYTDA